METCLAFLWRLAFGFSSVWSMLKGVRKFWFQHLESEATHTPNFPLFLTSSLSAFLWISLSVPASHASVCWGVCMLHTTEGTQLHRCVAWLAVFSICLEQPPLQDHRPWWRGSIWQLLIRHGASVPRHLPPPPTVSHPECSFETREAARRGNPSSLWPRALHLTLAPKWKNVHSTTTALWYRDLLFPQSSIQKPGEEYSAHPFVLIIHHPGACWKIIYCTWRWLTTQKRSLHACLISPPPHT